MKMLIISFCILGLLPLTAGKSAPPIIQSEACKMLEAEIDKAGKPANDEDFQRIGTRLPKDVYARARKNMDKGEKIAAVREIRACLNTGLMESKRIVELLP